MNDTEQPGQIPFSQELARKLTHLGALSIPAGYYSLGLSKLAALAILIPIFLFVLAVDISRLRNRGLWRSFIGQAFKAMIRKHEQMGDFTGATYILLAACCTIALFDKPVAIAALAFIIVGDSLAAIIGRRFGRHRYGHKSLEGSLACLAGTVLVALVTPHLAVPVGLLGALAATVFEAFPLGTDDNVTVPILSGLVMSLMQKITILG
jgi:dolichol kinase